MRRLSIIMVAAAAASLFSLTTPAKAAGALVTTATVDDCPSAISATVVGPISQADPLQIALGVEVGRNAAVGGPCLTPHVITALAYLWLVAPNGGSDIKVAELQATAGNCPVQPCTRTQGFANATLPPGIYRLSGEVKLDSAAFVPITGQRFLYTGRDLTVI